MNEKEKWKDDFFKKLSEKMEQFTKDNALLKNEDTGEWMMRTAFATSAEKTDFVLLQAAPFQAREDVLLLEIYIKMLEKGERIEELQKAISELNSYLPVGCLGIYPTDQHVFLRDCFRLDTEKTAEAAAEDAVTAYELMMEVVVGAYPGLKAINSGEMTYQECVEKAVLNKYSK